jgi:penicillin-insensitive murein endopeptidase
MGDKTMRGRLFCAVTVVAGLLAADAGLARDATPAKQLFGKVPTPAEMKARSIGSYARGCMAGAKALPVDGPAWQAMRLSRNRYWGMPELVSYVERLAVEAREKDGWPGLLVGDLSQPRGGPMLTGHASHQIGLDVDVWFVPMPARTLTQEEREKISAISLIKPGTNVELDRSKWPSGLSNLLRRAAKYPEVERIFVNAGIKKELCDGAGTDRAWLRKIRPWYKHDDHFHVRLFCPPGIAGCKAQDATPPGDGCGENLAYWLSPAPYKPAPKPKKPVRPLPELTLADLPAGCADVLTAGAGAPVAAEAGPAVPIPVLRPKAD